MKRMPVVAVFLTALFAAAPAAHAKGVMAAQVCGANGCNDVTDRSQLDLFLQGGDPTDPPSSTTGWYRARLTIGADGSAEDHFTIVVVPDQRRIRGSEGVWMPIGPDAADAYRQAARGLEPFPASKLGLKPVPPVQQVGSTTSSDTGSGDDGIPWVVIVIGTLAALAAVALSPRVRRRLAGPESSS
jgi:hypothetical protein